MKDLIPKDPALIIKVLIEAGREKGRQKTIQKKVRYITEVTATKVDSVNNQTLQIFKKKGKEVFSLTDSIFDTIKQNLDNLSPLEVLYFMDLIHKAQKRWCLSDEEAKALIDDIENTSFPLD